MINISTEEINHYIHLLAAESTTQEQVVHALARIGMPAIPALLEALRDPNRWFAAAQALTLIGQPAIQPLIDVMREPPLGNFAFHALSAMGSLAAPAFITALSDTDAEVRMWAASAFEWEPDNRAYDALSAAIHDSNAIVRATVVRAIGKLNRPEILPQLEALQDSESDYQVQQALEATIQHLSGITQE